MAPVRTAEVTARFTLEALPGKADGDRRDMNAGLIDEHGARRRREGSRARRSSYRRHGWRSQFNQRDSLATILNYGIISSRACNRRAAAGHRPDDRGQDLHHPYRWRWLGDHDPQPSGNRSRWKVLTSGPPRPASWAMNSGSALAAGIRCGSHAACSRSWPWCRECLGWRFS